MKILLKNIGTDEFMHDQKVAVGAPSLWSSCMYLHALVGETCKALNLPSNALKIESFSYFLHEYTLYQSNKLEPQDGNRKGLMLKDFRNSDLKAQGMKDTRTATVRISLLVTINTDDINPDRVLGTLRNVFFGLRLFGGNYNRETILRDVSKTIIEIDNEASVLENMRKIGGFICKAFSIPDGQDIVEVLLSETVSYKKKSSDRKADNQNKETNNADTNDPVSVGNENDEFSLDNLPDIKREPRVYRKIRGIVCGYASVSGPPTEREGSRGGKNHVFAEPIIKPVEWVFISKLKDFDDESCWTYHVNNDKTVFIVKPVKGE